MNVRKRDLKAACLAAWPLVLASACSRNTPPPVAAAPPKPAVAVDAQGTAVAPSIALFSAEPSSILRGQAATLRWEVTGQIARVALDHVDAPIRNTGQIRVAPDASVTYTLTAMGPGGTTTSMVTVRVRAAPPPVPGVDIGSAAAINLEGRLAGQIQDAFFDYNKTDIRPDARETLALDATALKSIFAEFPGASVYIEGHADERGSAEYNLGLADLRASSVRTFLLEFGLEAERLKTLSYGKDRQQCAEPTESCWQKNRRVHFTAASGEASGLVLKP